MSKDEIIELLNDILNFCEENKSSNEYDYVIDYEPDDIQFISTRPYLKNFINDKIAKIKGDTK